VHEVSTLAQLEAALSLPPPALIRATLPGRQENVARHQALNDAVRLALT
jgi:hypothetical protein